MTPGLLFHPDWLAPLAWLLAGAASGLVAGRWRAGRRRRALLGPRATPPPGSALRDAALWLALAAIATGLLGPRLGERVVRVPAAGVDVVFLVDVSRSMNAEDVPPSRLDRARRSVREILARLEPRDRAALAVFGGRGALLTPLTPDHDALAELVEALDTDLVHPAASYLGSGVRAALRAFEAGSDRPRVLFVVSDGEDPEGRADVGAANAARADVRVLAAALGSDAGATLPDYGVPLRDDERRVVVSRRDRARLARLTDATGGVLFAGDAWGEIDLDAAARAVRRDSAGRPGELVLRRVPAVRVAPFAGLAFVLLLGEGLRRAPAPFRRRGRPPRRLGPAAVAGGLAFAVGGGLAAGGDPADRDVREGEALPPSPGVAGLEARLRAGPGDPALLLHLGAARLEAGDPEGASRAFLAAGIRARDPELAALAYHDLGVAALARGELEAARDAFFDALALASRGEARFNLEWTLRALATAPAPPLPGAQRPDPDREAAERSEPDEALAPAETAEQPLPKPEAKTPAPVELSESERQRWLDRVEDDPTRALRSAPPDAGGRRRPAGPVW